MSGTAARTDNPFDTRTIAWVIVAGVLAFAGFLLLTAYARPIVPRGGDFAPLSKNATGFAGLFQLIEGATGTQVATLSGNNAYNEPGLVIVPLAPDSDVATIRELATERADNVPGGATLFILPKWRTLPVSLFSDRVQRTGRIDGATLNRLANTLGVALAVGRPEASNRLRGLPGIARPALNAPLTIGRGRDTQAVVPLLAIDEAHVLLARLPRFAGGPVYLLSDPDLLANHALGTPQGARAALAIIAAVQPTGDDRIAIDPEPARATQGGGRNLLQLMFEPPFLALTLAVLAAAIMAGIHSFGRFGPAEAEARAIPFGKRALADNTARLFARAGAVKRLGDRYVALTRDAAAARLGASAMAPDALEAWLSRLRPNGTPFATLASNARGADTTEAMRAAAAALHQWKEEVTRDRR